MPQAVVQVQFAQFAHGLFVEGACIGRFVEIEVTAEKLVGSFAGKDHFDTHRLDYAGEQVHRRRSPHGGHIVGLEVIDDIPQRIQALLDRVVDFVVHGADVVGYFTSCGQVGCTFESYGERV